MNIYNRWDDDVEVFKDASYRYKMTNYVVNNSSELAERMNNMLMMERRFNPKTKVQVQYKIQPSDVKGIFQLMSIRDANSIMKGNDISTSKLKAYVDKLYELRYRQTRDHQKIEEIFRETLYSGNNRMNHYIDSVYDYGETDVQNDPINLDDCSGERIIFDPNRQSMYAGREMAKGDVVETCPVIFLNRFDLTNKNIKDCCMPIGNGVFALPLGYALQYKHSRRDYNADYEYDDINKVLIIKCVEPIEAGQPITLRLKFDD